MAGCAFSRWGGGGQEPVQVSLGSFLEVCSLTTMCWNEAKVPCLESLSVFPGTTSCSRAPARLGCAHWNITSSNYVLLSCIIPGVPAPQARPQAKWAKGTDRALKTRDIVMPFLQDIQPG